jgi:hypothetical protein
MVSQDDSISESERFGRALLIFSLACCSWVLLAFGLISPLTPSEGCPSLVAVLFFAITPLGMTSACSLYSSGRMTKAFYAMQGIAQLVVLGSVVRFF